MSKKIIVTISDIRDKLWEACLDTEYREALANSMMLLNLVSNSHLNLYFGSQEQREEIKRVETTPLNSNQLSEIIHLMMYEMRNDFQYGRFKPIAEEYINISKNMRKQELKNQNTKNEITERPKCYIYGIRCNV